MGIRKNLIIIEMAAQVLHARFVLYLQHYDFIINLNISYGAAECAVAISLLFQSTECKFIQQSHEVIAMTASLSPSFLSPSNPLRFYWGLPNENKTKADTLLQNGW